MELSLGAAPDSLPLDKINSIVVGNASPHRLGRRRRAERAPVCDGQSTIHRNLPLIAADELAMPAKAPRAVTLIMTERTHI